jgi:beta-alanine degradation protein BauB
MKMSRLFARSVPLITFLIFATPIGRAQDMVKVAPKDCKVVFENDRVRVVQVVTKPGEKMPMHSHPDYILYSLTPGKEKITSSDGKSREREFKAGQVTWVDAVTHSTENVGTAEHRSLVIEFKK